jgi:hypothetical protein
MGGAGEQAKRVTGADFLGGRPSGQTQPGELGRQGERPLRESEIIHLAGTDRITEIDCRRTSDERHQVLRAGEMGRRKGCRFARCGPC